MSRPISRPVSRPISTEGGRAPVGRTAEPPDVPHRLAAQIGFIVEVDALKTVLRRSPLIAAERRENDAEHSWHLALMVTVLAEYSDVPLDVGRTTQLVLLHDLVEIYAGDTFLYDAAGAADQQRREQAAADRLFALLPADQAARFRALWDEFEERRTPEARFAKAMDRLQPLLANFHNQGGTWRTPGVTSAVERDHMAVIADASTPLWDYAQQLIEHAADQGWIAAGQTS